MFKCVLILLRFVILLCSFTLFRSFNIIYKMTNIQVQTSGIVELTISNSLSSFTNMKRLERNFVIDDVKSKLELITGIPCGSMCLEVYSEDNKLTCQLDNGQALLGSYQIDNGMRLHVIDTEKNRAMGEFEDVSKVKKFELDDEEYSKKRDSVRAFMKKNKMGKYDPEEQERKKIEEEDRLRLEAEERKRIIVGKRCEVKVPKQMTRRGTVRFVGETEFKPHLWVGVEYDEPMGKNNGTVQGKQYFICQDKYGAFVKPQYVVIGNFPELGMGSDDDEM